MPDGVVLFVCVTVENRFDFCATVVLCVFRHLGERVDAQGISHPTVIVGTAQAELHIGEVDAQCESRLLVARRRFGSHAMALPTIETVL